MKFPSFEIRKRIFPGTANGSEIEPEEQIERRKKMSTLLAEVSALPSWAQIALGLLVIAWIMTGIVLIGSINGLFGYDYERRRWIGTAGGFVFIIALIVAVLWVL